ncbi:MAG: helix-turn-helix transcriptional regulator [Planctomycetota bacterium]
MSASHPQEPQNSGRPNSDPILVSYTDLAHLLSLSVRELRRLVDRGRLPKPVRVGRRKLFRLAQVRRVIDDMPDDSED